VATIEIVVHWVAKKPEKFKWVSGQKSLGTIAVGHIQRYPGFLFIACFVYRHAFRSTGGHYC
jgi:hypothetical protein